MHNNNNMLHDHQKRMETYLFNSPTNGDHCSVDIIFCDHFSHVPLVLCSEAVHLRFESLLGGESFKTFAWHYIVFASVRNCSLQFIFHLLVVAAGCGFKVYFCCDLYLCMACVGSRFPPSGAAFH